MNKGRYFEVLIGSIVLLVFVGLIVFSYRDVGGLEFVWDDQAFLVNHQSVRSAKSLYDFFFQPFFVSDDYYRPLVVISYAIQYRISGLAADSFHWVNVLIHCLNSILVSIVAMVVMRRVGASVLAGMAVGACYALHPATVEAVAWVSGRFDLLMTTFLLFALCFDVCIRDGWLKAIAIGGLFALAAFCKETAVGFALCYPVWRMWVSSVSGAVSVRDEFNSALAAWRTYCGIVAAGFLYLFLRFISMGYLISGTTYNNYGGMLQRVMLSAKAFLKYAWTSLFPYQNISPIHYQKIPIPLGDAGGLFSLAFLAVFIVYLGILWGRGRREVSYASFVFFLSILAALHVLQTPLQDNLIQERYLQFPLALFLVMFFLVW